jgi:hypothetical protein
MSLTNDESMIPKEVLETAALAEELHGRLYPQEGTPQEPVAGDEPKSEPEPQNEPAPEPEHQDDTDYKAQALLYKSRLESLSAQYRETKQTLESMKAVKEEPKSTEPSQYDEVIAKLKEEYPEELIENLLLLNRLQAEQVVTEKVRPVQETASSVQEIQEQIAQQNYAANLTQKAPHWNSMWSVLQELEQGVEPSDPKIANFLLSPDPSGLYTNMQLLDMYNENWDVDKFATVCNLYQAKPQQAQQHQTSNRDALMAPARSNSQPAPASNEKRIWTMREFEQFQKDERSGKYEGRESEAEALWTDATQALSEGRFR